MNPKLFTYKLKLSGYKKIKQGYFMVKGFWYKTKNN